MLVRSVHHKPQAAPPQSTPSWTYLPTMASPPSLDVPLQELPVEVTADSVVDEAPGGLYLAACLVLEHHILIPSAATQQKG